MPWTSQTVDNLVLGTVNAPYKAQTDAAALLAALKAAEPWGLPQLHSLFSDVKPALAFAFAQNHGLAPAELKQLYQAYLAKGGLPYPNFEKALEQLEDPARARH